MVALASRSRNESQRISVARYGETFSVIQDEPASAYHRLEDKFATEGTLHLGPLFRAPFFGVIGWA